MWDPVNLSHYCDRCDAEVNITLNDYRLALFTSGGRNIPPNIPEELEDNLRGFGFKAPLFCFNCVIPMMKLNMDECANFKKRREEGKSELPG